MKKVEDKVEAVTEEALESNVAPKPELDPRNFSYKPDGMVEVPAQTFEVLRAYFAEQSQRFPPKKYFLHQEPVVVKKKVDGKTQTIVEWQDFDSDEAYKAQKPVEMRDTDSFNIVYISNILHSAHVSNIESGNAISIDVLRAELEDQKKSRMQKVEADK